MVTEMTEINQDFVYILPHASERQRSEAEDQGR